MNHQQLLEKNILLKYLVLFFLFYASWLQEAIFQSKVSKISWHFCKHRKEMAHLTPWRDKEKPNWKTERNFLSHRQKGTQVCYKQSSFVFAAASLLFNYVCSSFPGTRVLLFYFGLRPPSCVSDEQLGGSSPSGSYRPAFCSTFLLCCEYCRSTAENPGDTLALVKPSVSTGVFLGSLWFVFLKQELVDVILLSAKLASSIFCILVILIG